MVAAKYSFIDHCEMVNCFLISCLLGKKKNPGLKLAKEVFAQPTPAAA